MFRKMRRAPQALTEEEIINVLETETRGVLSVQGDDGYPYGFPINHFYDRESNKLYFHGAKIGHRVDAIMRDPKVSFCVYGQDYVNEGEWAKNVKSVIAFGKAEIIEDYDEMLRICRLICTKFPATQEYVEHELEHDGPNTLCFAVNIEHITGKLVNEA